MPGASDAPESPHLKLGLKALRRHLDAFVTEYLAEKSEETVGTYQRSLRTFQKWFVQINGRFYFREDDVRAYKTYLGEERGLSQVSVSTYLTALRRFCQYLVDTGALSENPAAGVKGNRRPDRHTRKVLTEADITALKEELGGSSPIDKRDVAMVHLMLYAGLTEIEIVRANVEDLDHTLMGPVLYVQSKGHTAKDQQAPLDPPVLATVEAYLQTRDQPAPSAPLFVSHGHRSAGQRLKTRSVRSRINGYLKAAGIKRRGITPHSLTHTAALIWLNEGMPLEEVKERMRHGTLETTMIYYKKQGLLTRAPEDT
ncbi:tyrosine-type recombinase/integrase [Salisaeta longa]|uniref:tyrosine-type recombinase/integrase n=1 Tax=Salisaeta longa TaxID=503170 RepID=UPI0003B6C751|nr:tyrosine-type recombinase/integrase [Salisaeta longa]